MYTVFIGKVGQVMGSWVGEVSIWVKWLIMQGGFNGIFVLPAGKDTGPL